MLHPRNATQAKQHIAVICAGKRSAWGMRFFLFAGEQDVVEDGTAEIKRFLPRLLHRSTVGRTVW